MTFSAPIAAPTSCRPDRVGDRAGRDDRSLADHQPWYRGHGADAAGVRQCDVGARQIVGGERVGASLLDELVVGVEEAPEVESARVADHGHHQRPRSVLLLDVDRETEVDGAVVDAIRDPVGVQEVVRHHRHLVRRRTRDRVRDQVRERDPLARLLELAAARLERRHGQRPERRRGRQLPALLHVARERCAAALDPLRSRWKRGRRRGGAVGGSQHVVLGDPPPTRGSGDASQIHALGRRDALRDRCGVCFLPRAR